MGTVDLRSTMPWVTESSFRRSDFWMVISIDGDPACLPAAEGGIFFLCSVE